MAMFCAITSDKLRRMCWLGLLALTHLVLAGQGNDSRRKLALVIGNDAYESSPLANSVNDAKDVAGALDTLGFRSQLVLNATRGALEQSVESFILSLRPGDTTVLYYSEIGRAHV